MEFLEIDGGFGEGGGQIVRTAITLSCITKKPIIVNNIRKNRKVPGLRPQHLTALNILRKICDGKVKGGKIGSTNFRFIPNNVKDSELVENIGTAGSIPLILQALIPAVAICKNKLKISIIGGTDVSWSPSSNYTLHILREVYSRMGINFLMDIEKRGYFPKGGGKINLEVFPTKNLKPIVLVKKNLLDIKLICSFSKLTDYIIKQQISKIENILFEKNLKNHTTIVKEDAIDSGASLLIYSKDENSVIGIDALFDKKTNKFDEEIIEKFISSKNIDENLSDMLVIPASLANGMTVFRVKKITKHLETNLFVASKITGCKYGIGKLNDCFEIRIEGVLNSSIQNGCKK